MKLRTKMQAWRDGKTIPVAPDTSKSFFMMEHDAAAAHALMRAVTLELPMPQLMSVKAKADELMREWGFDREAGK